jgi:hypothetical protein
MNFKEKVQSMTAKEIIMSMVDSLIDPLVNVDMGSYGFVKRVPIKFLGIKFGGKGVCFGCAATNTICNISGKVLDKSNIKDSTLRANFINSDPYFLSHFEYAIDHLRQGALASYNRIANEFGFAQIKRNDIELPALENDYTKLDLDVYIKLADFQ